LEIRKEEKAENEQQFICKAQLPLTLRCRVLDNKEFGAILPLSALRTLRRSESMETTSLPDGPQLTFRALIGDSLRFWEPRRLIYNLVLFTVVVTWVAATWPHFRAMFEVHSLLLLAFLALVANASYCAAYLLDIPMQCSAFGNHWRRLRWVLWLAGMLVAILLANYWISDEIYPFIR
jgi:hypothetical protein